MTNPDNPSCDTCAHFFTSASRRVTYSIPVVTPPKFFWQRSTLSWEERDTLDIREECRRFPHYEPRPRGNVCGEYKPRT